MKMPVAPHSDFIGLQKNPALSKLGQGTLEIDHEKNGLARATRHRK